MKASTTNALMLDVAIDCEPVKGREKAQNLMTGRQISSRGHAPLVREKMINEKIRASIEEKLKSHSIRVGVTFFSNRQVPETFIFERELLPKDDKIELIRVRNTRPREGRPVLSSASGYFGNAADTRPVVAEDMVLFLKKLNSVSSSLEWQDVGGLDGVIADGCVSDLAGRSWATTRLAPGSAESVPFDVSRGASMIVLTCHFRVLKTSVAASMSATRL